jgi:hypothetical protein
MGTSGPSPSAVRQEKELMSLMEQIGLETRFEAMLLI